MGNRPHRIMLEPGDRIVLETVESYMRKSNLPKAMSPEENLVLLQGARDYLYKEIAMRTPRIIQYIFESDLETEQEAAGLNYSLQDHMMDPCFVGVLMNFLKQSMNTNYAVVTGAFMTLVIQKYLDEHPAETKPTPPPAPTKKGDKEKDTTPPPAVKENKTDISKIAHLDIAVKELLGDLGSLVQSRCGNLNDRESLAVAACIAMNNEHTVASMIENDLPVTANLFDILSDPTDIIISALLLEKADFVKVTNNQSAFIDSLRRWVYNKLNTISIPDCGKFLTAVYGSARPTDLNKYLINIKDCGTTYTNLLFVSKQMSSSNN